MNIEQRSRLECYKDIFEVFLEKVPSDELLLGYFEEYDNGIYDNFYDLLIDFIVDNLKEGLAGWVTNLSILDSADLIYKSAIENANIKPEKNIIGFYKTVTYQLTNVIVKLLNSKKVSFRRVMKAYKKCGLGDKINIFYLPNKEQYYSTEIKFDK